MKPPAALFPVPTGTLVRMPPKGGVVASPGPAQTLGCPALATCHCPPRWAVAPAFLSRRDPGLQVPAVGGQGGGNLEACGSAQCFSRRSRGSPGQSPGLTSITLPVCCPSLMSRGHVGSCHPGLQTASPFLEHKAQPSSPLSPSPGLGRQSQGRFWDAMILCRHRPTCDSLTAVPTPALVC